MVLVVGFCAVFACEFPNHLGSAGVFGGELCVERSVFFSLAIMSGTFVTLTHLGQIIHFAIDDNPTIFCRRMFGDFRHGNFGAIALCHDARCSLYLDVYISLNVVLGNGIEPPYGLGVNELVGSGC